MVSTNLLAILANMEKLFFFHCFNNFVIHFIFLFCRGGRVNLYSHTLPAYLWASSSIGVMRCCLYQDIFLQLGPPCQHLSEEHCRVHYAPPFCTFKDMALSHFFNFGEIFENKFFLFVSTLIFNITVTIWLWILNAILVFSTDFLDTWEVFIHYIF